MFFWMLFGFCVLVIPEAFEPLMCQSLNPGENPKQKQNQSTPKKTQNNSGKCKNPKYNMFLSARPLSGSWRDEICRTKNACLGYPDALNYQLRTGADSGNPTV